jgi:hypothetical protein
LSLDHQDSRIIIRGIDKNAQSRVGFSVRFFYGEKTDKFTVKVFSRGDDILIKDKL